MEYHFVNEEIMQEMKAKGIIIEQRAYHTKCGIWRYFTADDGQINLEKDNYLVIGTLESYEIMKKYFGETVVVPLYVEVEDGERLLRALERERRQVKPNYTELCRRFLADSEDFSEENLKASGVRKRFENVDFEQCVQEITSYIKGM